MDGQRYFRPDREITRAEATTIIGRAAGVAQTDVSEYPPLFLDDSANPAWALSSVAALYVRGWVTGFQDGSFHPAAALQRAQTAKILAYALGLQPADADPGSPRPQARPSGWTHVDGGPARNAFNPDATLGASAQPLWGADLSPIRGYLKSNVVLGDGLVFAADSHGAVDAVLPGSGKLLWHAAMPERQAWAELAFDPARNLLYVASNGDRGSRLLALNPATGRQVWVGDAGEFSWATKFSLLVAGDRIVLYSRGSTDYISAYDAATGRPLWQQRASGEGALALAGDAVIYQYSTKVTAYRVSDGTQLWQHDVPDSSGSPTTGHGLVFIVNRYGGMLALNQATGQEVWRRPATAQVAVDDRYVWAPWSEGRIALLDPATGATVRELSAGCSATPAISAASAFVVCDGHLKAIDRTSFQVSEMTGVLSVAALDSNRLYYSRRINPWDSEGVLAALQAQ